MKRRRRVSSQVRPRHFSSRSKRESRNLLSKRGWVKFSRMLTILWTLIRFNRSTTPSSCPPNRLKIQIQPSHSLNLKRPNLIKECWYMRKQHRIMSSTWSKKSWLKSIGLSLRCRPTWEQAVSQWKKTRHNLTRSSGPRRILRFEVEIHSSLLSSSSQWTLKTILHLHRRPKRTIPQASSWTTSLESWQRHNCSSHRQSRWGKTLRRWNQNYPMRPSSASKVNTTVAAGKQPRRKLGKDLWQSTPLRRLSSLIRAFEKEPDLNLAQVLQQTITILLIIIQARNRHESWFQAEFINLRNSKTRRKRTRIKALWIMIMKNINLWAHSRN